MLTAKTKDGRKLCLGFEYKKETLLYLRKKEEFFCPVCGERVILKLGVKKIFHFAHKGGTACRDFIENESEAHLKGKLQLFQWLKSQKIPTELEYYDNEIGQRPDMMFVYNGRKYAVEYQCSAIPEQLFMKRTSQYLQYNYTPIWILGENQYHSFGSLTSFHYLFLQQTRKDFFYIPYYSPDKKIFLLQHAIFPYSAKNALYQKVTIPINQMKLPTFLDLKVDGQLNIFKWLEKQERYKLRFAAFPTPSIKTFQNEIYQNGLNLFLLPAEIGIPVPHSFLFQNPVFVWQTYLYHDVFKNKQQGDSIHIKEAEICLKKRIKKGDIILRNLPLLSSSLNPIKEYMFFLVDLGILEKMSEDLFRLKKHFKIPTSNSERSETMQEFQKNLRHKALMKFRGRA